MTNSDLNNKFPESIKVLEVFNHSEYEVPIYQRNYAWGKEEIEQLIKDIYESKFNSDNQSYYLGNLIVNRIETDTYEVIDGSAVLMTMLLGTAIGGLMVGKFAKRYSFKNSTFA